MARTHAQIVNLWPTARDLAVQIRVEVETVRRWRQRNRIPLKHWGRIVNAAKDNRYGVTHQELALGMLGVNGK